MKKEGIFLGSSGAIQVPSFHCNCDVCNEARSNNNLKRTRASFFIKGIENSIFDISPDLAFQLERERINIIHNIFITHWHFDHISALPELHETSIAGKWSPINFYIHENLIENINNHFSYLKNILNINPIKVGDKINISDCEIEIVKTNHTETSVGFIINASKSICYLGDGIEPEEKTIRKIKNCEYLICESTLDELILNEDEPKWYNFSLSEALKFWRKTKIPNCILTHISCHSWKNGSLCCGYTNKKRKEIENQNKGLQFAYDGLRLMI